MNHIINHCQSIYSMLQNTLQITLVNGLEKFLWKVIPKDSRQLSIITRAITNRWALHFRAIATEGVSKKVPQKIAHV